MENTIGTCSLCGGPVVVPALSVDPVPYCKRCGATAKQPFGPPIEMEGGAKDGSQQRGKLRPGWSGCR